MDREVREEIEQYRKDLLQKLENAKRTKKEFNEVVASGYHLTLREQDELRKANETIGDVEEKLQRIETVDYYERIENNFELLKDNHQKKEQKEEIINELTRDLNTFDGDVRKEIKDLTGSEINTYEDLLEAQKEVDKDLEVLEVEQTIAEKRGYDTLTIKYEIEDKEYQKDVLNRYEKSYFDERIINKDLQFLGNYHVSRTRKDEVSKKYTDIIGDIKESAIQDVLTDKDTEKKNYIEIEGSTIMNEENKEKEIIEITPEEAEAKRKEKSEKLEKVLTGLAAAVGACVAIATLVLALKACGKHKTADFTTDKDTSLDSDKTIEYLTDLDSDTIDEVIDKIITETETTTKDKEETEESKKAKALVNLGYDESKANLIIQNFNEETVNKLMNSPYIPEVNNYVYEKEFNLDYLKDYEETRNIYNITSSKTVDYVNRAHSIEGTKFFYEATAEDIIPVLISIDNKDIIKDENGDLLQSIYNPINEIAEKYLFYANTADDVTKLDALGYLAKEGSDLDNFFTAYKDLAQDIIREPENHEPKDILYHGIAIFASSLNHYDNAACALTDDEKFNEDFQVRDPFDYAIAYRTLIQPTMPILPYKEIEDVDGKVIEYIESFENEELRDKVIEEYKLTDMKDAITRSIELKGINRLIKSAINNEVECEKKLTLGGER